METTIVYWGYIGTIFHLLKGDYRVSGVKV